MSPKDVRNAEKPERIREETTQASIQETDLPTEILEAADSNRFVAIFSNVHKRAGRLFFLHVWEFINLLKNPHTGSEFSCIFNL